MLRAIAGHGRFNTRYPPLPSGTLLPCSSSTSAPMLGKGKVAEPGLRVVMPGNGVMRIWPVSVIHQVSTTGQRSAPITSRYQTQASGLIGSPTVPRTRRLDRSCFAGYSLPHFMNVRMAVGAVYRIVTPYFSTIDQKRSLSGKSGDPSYSTQAAPLVIGP